MKDVKHIVVIGGGFGGLKLAQTLGSHKSFRVTLVDKNNYNYFPPLIYQVATAFLEPSSISYPFRKLFAPHANLHFRLAEFKKVLPAENKVVLSNGELPYDYLVFATGAATNYFGMENVKQNATPMKTLSDAITLRNKMLQGLEQASICQDPVALDKALTIVIAGGGPTGVELAGMFAEMRKGMIRREYKELAGKTPDIYLVDGSDTLLKSMSLKSQQNTLAALTQLGVKVKLNRHVKDYNQDTVLLDNGETIAAKTLIWAAGVTAKTFTGLAPESYGRGQRLRVDAHNQVQGYQNVYAIGDTCLQTTDSHFPNGHPQVAQVAIQQGKNLAKNFKLIVLRKPVQPFAYFDKGSMAIIGRSKAVADMFQNKLSLKGFVAWIAWLFIHLISLVTHHNRVKTLNNWMIAFFTKDQALRMIIQPNKIQPSLVLRKPSQTTKIKQHPVLPPTV